MAKPFHERLAAWRAKRGYSQQFCADAVGVVQTIWSRYEAGERTPRRPVRILIERFTDGAVKAVDS